MKARKKCDILKVKCTDSEKIFIMNIIYFRKSAQNHGHHVLIISFQIRNVPFDAQTHMSIGMEII